MPEVATQLSLPVLEPQSTEMTVDTATCPTTMATADLPMLSEAQYPPVPTEGLFTSLLINPASPSEVSGLTANGQGAICAITPTPKVGGEH